MALTQRPTSSPALASIPESSDWYDAANLATPSTSSSKSSIRIGGEQMGHHAVLLFDVRPRWLHSPGWRTNDAERRK